MRGYAKDAAPRGKHAAKKARQGEGALDEEFDPAYDSEPDDCFDDAAPTAAPTAVKGKRALGPQARLEQTPDQGLVFWCALCNDKKPVQSTKAIASHRAGGKQSCWRGSGKPNATLDEQCAEGFLSFSEPPPPPQRSASSRGGAVGRGGRGGGRAGPGRGRKSAATKAAADAKLASFLAAKFGGQSKFAAQALASSTAGPSASIDDVEVLGEMTWAERDAELRSEAVDCDAD